MKLNINTQSSNGTKQQKITITNSKSTKVSQHRFGLTTRNCGMLPIFRLDDRNTSQW